jgi:hypothetical protein
MFRIKLCLLLRTLQLNTLLLPYIKGSILQLSVIPSKCQQVVDSFETYTLNSIPRLYGCDAFTTEDHGEETACLKRGRHKTSDIRN